ncbi:MAG TPA: SCO family protein [Gammaproteobacteria bacterium]|jgi:protein SCO1/2
MLRVLVVALVLLVAVMFMVPRNRAPGAPRAALQAATVLPQPRPLPDFALIDTSGQEFTRARLRGRHRLLFFGFTHCPDICPLTLQVLATAVDEIAAKAPDLVPEVVFVSVDPNRDTPERIRDYLRNFDAQFVGAVGSDAALEPLIQALGVTVHRVETDGEHYNMVHNGTVFVIDPNAALVAIFGGTSHDAGAIVSDYLRIRGRSTAAP